MRRPYQPTEELPEPAVGVPADSWEFDWTEAALNTYEPYCKECGANIECDSEFCHDCGERI